MVELPYLVALPEGLSIDADGKTLYHKRFGKGHIISAIIVFPKHIMQLSYRDCFGEMVVV